MKIFVCGYARHGKDTAAEILRKAYGLTYTSSSIFCMRLFLRDQLRERYGLTYDNDAACFLDRTNHRDKWHAIITEYNAEDPARLSRCIFASHDIYVGIRSMTELLAAKPLANVILWVHNPRLPAESTTSNKLTWSCADMVVVNDGTIHDMRTKLLRIFDNMTGLS